jgi:hypothetical protein
VRVEGSTGMLPAGYDAVEVGKGALCMTCHNTRNGAHNDLVGDPTSMSAPHVAAQADILMGQNAYFVEVGHRGGHSFIENTCTTCHMVETPPPAEYSYNGAGTNHTFEADMSTCTKCHGNYDGGTLQSAIEMEMEELAHMMGEEALAKLTAAGTIKVRAYDAERDVYSSASASDANVTVDLAANPLTHIGITEGHGQLELHLVFTSPVSVTWTDGTTTTPIEFGVQLQSVLDATDTKLYAAGGNFVKAGWNYLLIHGDGSHGVHNPSYVLEILHATMAQDLSF